jgi:hypothetical protein
MISEKSRDLEVEDEAFEQWLVSQGFASSSLQSHEIDQDQSSDVKVIASNDQKE